MMCTQTLTARKIQCNWMAPVAGCSQLTFCMILAIMLQDEFFQANHEAVPPVQALIAL